MAATREKYNAFNSLICLVMSQVNRNLLVELYNNVLVAGTLDQCDGYMNVILRDAVVIDAKGLQYGFDVFMVTKRKIRYIHLPKDINITSEIQRQLEEMRYKPRKAKPKPTFKTKRAKMNHMKVLEDIQN